MPLVFSKFCPFNGSLRQLWKASIIIDKEKFVYIPKALYTLESSCYLDHEISSELTFFPVKNHHCLQSYKE